MKKFDLELAKEGHPVQTKDGRPVRIICYDRAGTDYPMVALVKMPDTEKEQTVHYTLDGRFNLDQEDNKFDLVMAPTEVEGWVNLYKDVNTGNITVGGFIYDSEQKAITGGWEEDYLTTTKITWKE